MHLINQTQEEKDNAVTPEEETVAHNDIAEPKEKTTNVEEEPVDKNTDEVITDEQPEAPVKEAAEEKDEEKTEEETETHEEQEPVVEEPQTEVAEEKIADILDDLTQPVTEETEIVEEVQVTEIEQPEPVVAPKPPIDINSNDLTMEDLLKYEEENFTYKTGDIIEGTVEGINDKEVMVDIKRKSEGSIPLSEFPTTNDLQKGAVIKVYVVRTEPSGKVILSKKTADFHLALDKLKEVYKKNENVHGTVRLRVKGGMLVELMGLNAFLPGSQISLKPVPNLDQFIGKEMDFRIINLDEEKKNIIISRKKVIEEEQTIKVEHLLEKIEVGVELDGEVKNITDYGAFIDLGGIDGLLHITDMSWGQINHPSEMLNIGDKVKVKVIGYEEKDAKISLGIKQLVPHPWENVQLKYEEGVKVTAKVVNIVPYGAFVELEPGVEGLVHISEMSWTKKIVNPKQIVNVGDTIEAIVLSVSKEEKRISLGIKQMEANPWLVIDERYPVGKLVKGKVKNLTAFGAFVEIEDDIDGLIHLSDISWTKRITRPKDVFKKGQEIEAAVLSVDKHLHRIALGIKQLTEDPWQNLDEKLPVNSEVVGVITKIIAKGIIVDIKIDGETIEGFVPISHLAVPRLKRPEDGFKVGDEVNLKVIELDKENGRLILSIKAYFFSRNRDELQDFLIKHDPVYRVEETQEEPKKGNKEKVAAEKAVIEEVVAEEIIPEETVIEETVAEKVVAQDTTVEENDTEEAVTEKLAAEEVIQ